MELYSNNIYGEQQALFETGSFSGYRPLQQLGSSYLSATTSFKQPLCGNIEGWGPLSPFRYDFTPCFIDVWIASVAVFGLVLGPIAVWWLLRKKQLLGTSRNAHFYIKQVGLHRPIPPRTMANFTIQDSSSHNHCRCRRPARYPDNQLPEYMVWRLPSLDNRPNDPLNVRHIRYPMD